jgi:hypothetical protein
MPRHARPAPARLAKTGVPGRGSAILFPTLLGSARFLEFPCLWRVLWPGGHRINVVFRCTLCRIWSSWWTAGAVHRECIFFGLWGRGTVVPQFSLRECVTL